MISVEERSYLRDLARQQRELSALPVMQERTALWQAHNALEGSRPVISVEEGHYWRELWPDLRCQDPLAREIEYQLQNNIQRIALIGDDRVTPDFYALYYEHTGPLCGLGQKEEKSKSGAASDGTSGYHILPQIEVIEEDFHKLKPTELWLPFEKITPKKEAIEDIIGDFLPVKLINPTNNWGPSPMRYVIAFMGMENAYIAMMDEPEWFHRLMQFITDDVIRIYRFQEENGLMYLNNGNDLIGSGNWCFTKELPGKDFCGVVRSRDTWGHLNAEDASSISPDCFREFILPYQKRLAEEFGLIYYGCCEDVSRFWKDGIDQLPNVRKISISPWCNEAYMGEQLAGSRIIYSRKCRDFHFLSTNKEFDAEGFRANIRETVSHTKGCRVEYIFRDVMSLKGNNEKIRQAVQIVREETEESYCR